MLFKLSYYCPKVFFELVSILEPSYYCLSCLWSRPKLCPAPQLSADLQECDKNLSKNYFCQFFDTFLSTWAGLWNKDWPLIIRNGLCKTKLWQKSVKSRVLTVFCHFFKSRMFHKCFQSREIMCQKCIKKLDLSLFCYILYQDVSFRYIRSLTKMCQKCNKSQKFDTFLLHFWAGFWQNLNTFYILTDFWYIFGDFWTHFCHI